MKIQHARFLPTDPEQHFEGDYEKINIWLSLWFKSVKSGLGIEYKVKGQQPQTAFIDFIAADSKHVNIIEVKQGEITKKDVDQLQSLYSLLYFVMKEKYRYDEKKQEYVPKNTDMRKLRAVLIGNNTIFSFTAQNLFQCATVYDFQNLIDSKNQFWE